MFRSKQSYIGLLLGLWIAALLYSLIALWGSRPIHETADAQSEGADEEDASVCEPNSCHVRSQVTSQ